MSTLKLKSVTTIAAACALSLVSTATFAGRGGTPAPAASTTRVSAPAKPTTTAATSTAAKPTTTSPSTTAHATGQPGADCESLGNQPGHSMTAPGSAFNPVDGVAGTKYAGEQPQNSKNPTSVSQYDVACARSH